MSTTFRERALAEAARYGSDSWVFLRELLQNARDAGASRIDVTVSQDDERERLVCRDDGAGMSYEHARRYLFALYASSKEEDRRQVGQFGVGFWSVLRFRPERVVIRSRTRDEPGWQVTVAGDLSRAERLDATIEPGTEIVLERRRKPPDLERKVRRSVSRYGRFVTQRDRPDEPLLVTVNGRSVNSDLTLPPPSASFRKGKSRGVVALAAHPRVELYANGLFVREAACLEDLLEVAKRGHRGSRGSLTLPGSLAPHVLLDSADLEVLLARSDVRETRPFEQLVRAAERELTRLVERQLQALRPQPWYLPLWARLREAWGELGLLWALATLVVGVALGWTALAWQGSPERTTNPAMPRLVILDSGGAKAYSDLGGLYRGPQLDALTQSPTRVRLSYEPAHAVLFFTALVVEEPAAWQGPAPSPLPVAEYPSLACDESCVDVAVRLAPRLGPVRLPVPTGHRLDVRTVRLDGAPQAVRATSAGEPVLLFTEPTGGILEYRTGPATTILSPRPPPADAPPELQVLGARLATQPVGDRIRLALDFVARRVRYDRSAPAVALHRQARADGKSFLEAALDLGQGDCDIQNGLLASLLRLSGVEARLAVGWVGLGGVAAPGLHAWVEYFHAGRWRVADASARFRDGGSHRDDSIFLRLSGPDTASDVSLPILPPVGETAAGALPPAEAGAGTGTSAPRRPAVLSWLWTAALAAAVISFGALLAGRRRVAGSVRLASEESLAALLAGALQHAELARMPALRHGRFVPCLKGRPISLDEAERLASKSKLYSSSRGSHLAFRAASRGVKVIDAGAAEGEVTSLALGGVDLDEWSDLVDSSRLAKLARRINQELEAVGLAWRVEETAGLGDRLRLVDLKAIRLGSAKVLIDPDHADFAPAYRELDERPANAVLLALDVIAVGLELPAAERGRLLADAAQRALAEVAA